MYGLTSARGASAACFQYQQHRVYLEQRGRRLGDNLQHKQRCVRLWSTNIYECFCTEKRNESALTLHDTR